MIRAGALPALEPLNVPRPLSGLPAILDLRSGSGAVSVKRDNPPIPKGGTGPTQEAQVIMTLTTLPLRSGAGLTQPPLPRRAASPTRPPGDREQLRAADRLIALTRAAGTAPGSDPSVAALALATAANLPVLLWGQPGIGKSSTLTELARGLDLPLETVIASVHEPSDFSGLPVLGAGPRGPGRRDGAAGLGGATRRAGDGLLFLDELSSAPRLCRPRCSAWSWSGASGACALPDGVRIVAAANPAGSAADGWQLAPPLANRFVHLDWVHDPAVVVRGLGGTWPLRSAAPPGPARLGRPSPGPAPRSAGS